MDLDDLISRYIDGELDSQAEAELHHRLSVSPEARSALRSHRALREASRDTRILDTPSPALHAALFNRLQQDEGMARAAAAAVVPAEALAPPRREAIPSEMHKPGRRVRRRRTALWFALPMVLLATILANEFLIVENKETKQLAESTRQRVEAPKAAAPPVASGTAAAPSVETETAPKLELKDAAGSPSSNSIPSTVLETHNGLAHTSNGSGNGPVRSAPATRSVSRDEADFDGYRSSAPTDDAIATISGGSGPSVNEESIVNTLNDGASILDAARAADRSRREEHSMRLMSSWADGSQQTAPDSARAPMVRLNRTASAERRAAASNSALASGIIVDNKRNAELKPNAAPPPPPPPEPLENSSIYQNFDQMASSSNQIITPQMNLAQRSNYLADSSLQTLVRKDTTVSRATKSNASRKAAKSRSRRASRNR